MLSLLRRSPIGAALLTVLVASFLVVGLATPVLAQTPESNGVITKGFHADDTSGDIAAGSLVSFATDNSQNIVLTDTNSAGRLVGIIDKNPLLAISDDTQEFHVVLNGSASTLVSDINGPIKIGDKISPSPIAGVGMLASADGQVVGTAQANFDADKAESRTLDDTEGNAHTIHIGYIPVQVGVAFYQPPGSSVLPPFVQNLANSIAGRPVSVIRILICSLMLLISFVSITVLVYTSTRSALTSVGRNPLAAGAIRKSLYQVGVVVIAVAAGTLIAGYLILSV